MKKRIRSMLTAGAVLLSGFMGLNMPTVQLESSAADQWKFDFGGGAVEGGYTGVSASTGYNSAMGYGFSNTGAVSNVGASGSGALSDAVRFNDGAGQYYSSNNTFNVDLPRGLYQITVTLGDTNRTSVSAEGMLQIMNMTGNNARDSFQLPVTDGQLNLCCCAGKENYAYTLSTLEITKLSDDPTMKPTIWICGDSTVCNYYPKDTSVQAGWGQVLNQYVDTTKFEIRNMAASGQFAKGFVDAGQFKPIETYGKEGDFYFISIGINDTNYSNAEEYYTTVKAMAETAIAKGMKVILVKQQGRNGDATRNPLLTGRWFGGQLDTIGQELGLQVIDLFTLWQNHCISIGVDATTNLYMSGDTLHPNRNGALVLAKCVADSVNFDDTSIELPPELPVYRIGDLDNNDEVNAFDVMIAKKGMMQGFEDPSAEKAGDVDGDGSVSLQDISYMEQFVLAVIDQFPVDARYYAIHAEYYNGIRENTNSGYAGEAYVNLNNEVGSYVEFTVNVKESGNYITGMRVANGSTANRQMKIEVNGASEYWIQDFLSTNAWNNWETKDIVLPLNAGENKIRMTSYMDQGGPNIDYITVEKTDEPIAEVYDPNANQGNVTPVSNAVIYVASDSTGQSYRESYAPQQGWGYYLGNYFSSGITVSNHSIAGRSSKSFYDNGRLNTILEVIKEGDYLLVDFGINDAAATKEERYAPVCGKVENADTGSFEYYLKFYIEGALAKGATPILMSPTLSIKNQTQPFSAGYRNVDSACKMLADYYHIPYFDLGGAMATQFSNTAYNTVYNYYMASATEGGTDFTHFTETGADVVAKIIADGLKSLNIGLN